MMLAAEGFPESLSDSRTILRCWGWRTVSEPPVKEEVKGYSTYSMVYTLYRQWVIWINDFYASFRLQSQ